MVLRSIRTVERRSPTGFRHQDRTDYYTNYYTERLGLERLRDADPAQQSVPQ